MRNIAMLIVAFAVGAVMALWLRGAGPMEGQPSPEPAAGFAAVPGAIGSQDLTGAYKVVRDWPKDISTLPGNEGWTIAARTQC